MTTRATKFTSDHDPRTLKVTHLPKYRFKTLGLLIIMLLNITIFYQRYFQYIVCENKSLLLLLILIIEHVEKNVIRSSIGIG